eukprot:jgi/Hompol1/1067/HPOL_005507-RA
MDQLQTLSDAAESAKDNIVSLQKRLQEKALYIEDLEAAAAEERARYTSEISALQTIVDQKDAKIQQMMQDSQQPQIQSESVNHAEAANPVLLIQRASVDSMHSSIGMQVSHSGLLPPFTQIDGLRQQVTDLQAHLKHCISENEDLTRDRSRAIAELAEARKTVMDCTKLIDDSSNRYFAALSDGISALQATIAAMEPSSESTQRSFSPMPADFSGRSFSEIHRGVKDESIAQSLIRLGSMIGNHVEGIKRLNASLKTIKVSHDNQISETQTRYDNLHTETERVSRENKELTAETKQLQTQVRMLGAEMQAAAQSSQVQIAGLHEQIMLRKGTAETLESELQVARERIRSLQEETAHLTSNAAIQNQEMSRLQQSLMTSQQELVKQRIEREQLSFKLAEVTSQIEIKAHTARAEVAMLEAQIVEKDRQLQSALHSFERQSSAQNDRDAAYRQQLEAAQQELSRHIAQATDEQRKLIKLEAQQDAWNRDKIELVDLQNAHHSLKRQFASLEAEHSHEVSKLNRAIELADGEAHSLRETIDQLRRESGELRSEIRANELQIKSLVSETKSLESHKLELEQQLNVAKDHHVIDGKQTRAILDSVKRTINMLETMVGGITDMTASRAVMIRDQPNAQSVKLSKAELVGKDIKAVIVDQNAAYTKLAKYLSEQIDVVSREYLEQVTSNVARPASPSQTSLHSNFEVTDLIHKFTSSHRACFQEIANLLSQTVSFNQRLLSTVISNTVVVAEYVDELIANQRDAAESTVQQKDRQIKDLNDSLAAASSSKNTQQLQTSTLTHISEELPEDPILNVARMHKLADFMKSGRLRLTDPAFVSAERADLGLMTHIGKQQPSPQYAATRVFELEQSLSDHAEVIEMQKETLKGLSHTNTNLKLKIAQMREELRDSNSKQRNLSEQLIELAASKKRSEATVAVIESDMSVLRKQKLALEERIESMITTQRQRDRDAEESYNALQRHCRQVEAEKTRLESHAAGLAGDGINTPGSATRAAMQTSELQSRIIELSKLNQELYAANESLRAEFKQAQMLAIEQLRRDMTGEAESTEALRSKADQEAIQKHQDKSRRLQARIDELQEQVESLEIRLKAKETSLQQYAQAAASSEQECRQANMRVASIQSELQTAMVERDAIQKEYQAITRQAQLLLDRVAQLESNVSSKKSASELQSPLGAMPMMSRHFDGLASPTRPSIGIALDSSLEISNSRVKSLESQLRDEQVRRQNLESESNAVIREYEVAVEQFRIEQRRIEEELATTRGAMRDLERGVEASRVRERQDAQRISQMEDIIDRLRVSLHKSQKKIVEMQDKLTRSFERQIGQIVTKFDAQSSERTAIEKSRLKTESAMQAAYEQQIKCLRDEVYCLRKELTALNSARTEPRAKTTVFA